ncbi:hypothetical protein B566_EDAN016080 [Ephemera danica]|nr:hypothetical protein B566_EDAN016080 [Ephemera danica]
MLRCGTLVTARLLLALVISQVAAVPVSPWAPGMRRALGAGPAAAAAPKEQAVASPTNPMFPFMTLKPYLPMKPANPFTPAFVPDPQIFVDKKTELLNNLFSSPAMMGGGAFGPAAESASASKPWASVGPGGPWAPPAPSKRALGPWGVAATPSPWAPTAPAPVDPSLFMGKKADFLSKLFSELDTTAGKPMTGPAAPVAPFVPPSFWMPLPPMPPTTAAPEVDAAAEAKSKLLAQLLQALEAQPATPPILLAPTPTTASKMVVPPSYWIPSSPLAGPGTYMKKVSDYLDKLFDSLNVTASPATEEGTVTRSLAARHQNDEWRQQEWVRAVTTAQTADTTNSPLAAKDLVVNSILNEVGALKSAMMDTLNEMITKQKEAAAATATTKKPMKFGPFPWGPTPKPTPDPTEPYQKRLETLGQVFDMLTALGQEVATGSSVTPTAAASNSTTVSRVARGLPEQAASLRSVQMAMHQGYQSMPAGTEEVISAGAGRDPTTAHEGGGLNLKV